MCFEEGYVISVSNCRAQVCACIPNERGWTLVPAENWEELEEEAIEAVEAQGGAINISGFYHCPAELADKAVFNVDV